uniref:UPAR/Ly6 domain-containing protein n=1 Tax=Anabas testudineus TaxID=64144 RepID=A0A7N6AWF4_ANATE
QGSLQNMLQLLYVAVLWFHLFPSLLCGNLLCFYRPLMEKEKWFEFIVTECPPHELCFKADGRYGNYSALSARGCMAEKDCIRVHGSHFKGTVYTMSYTCCDWPYCNSCPGISATSLSISVTFMTAALMAGNW